MTTSRDLDQVLERYLQDGPDELADRSYDDVRTAVDHIQQRTVIGPWRTPQMPHFARLAAVGVVAFVLSLAGIYLVPMSSNIGQQASPPPSPTATSFQMVETQDFIALAPGTYVTGRPFLVRATFTLPPMQDGWEGRLGGPYLTILGTATTDLLDFTFIDKVISNPCDPTRTVMNPQPGSSAAELANAMANLPLLQSTMPTDVTIGGRPAKHLTLTAPPAGRTCAAWTDPLGNDYEIAPGASLPVWIVDVGGKSLFITAPPHDTPLSADTQAAVQAVVDSIQLEPVETNSQGSPSAAGTTSPSPSASPMALPNLTLSNSVPLTAGTYSIDDQKLTNAQELTFTVPDGWSTHEGFVVKNEHTPNEVMFSTWTLTDIFSDACQWGTLVPVGTSVDELMQALTKQGSRTSTSPNSLLIGGFEAEHTVMTVSPNLDPNTCTNGHIRFWPDAGPDLNGGLCCDLPGNIDVVYGVDVNGRRLVIVARHYPGSSDAAIGELQGIISSIHIVPLPITVSSTPEPSPSPTVSPASPGPSGA
jgi:hypothetical protein